MAINRRNAATGREAGEAGRSFAVILGKGAYADERVGASSETGPRKDFLVVADALDADIHSYLSGADRLGPLFKRLFARFQIWGSALNAALLAGRYDAMFVTGEDIGLRLALFMRLLGRKCRLVCVVHNWTPDRDRYLRLASHRQFSAFVVVSQAQIALLAASGIPRSKIHHGFDAVDDRFYRQRPPIDLSNVEGAEGDFIAACGAENRDYETLAEAMKGIDCRLKIFGSGFWGANVASRPEKLSGNVEMMPRVSFPELRGMMARAKALAIPLNAVSYAAGVNGLMEALAIGRPVVVTENPGIAEYLEPVPAESRVQAGDIEGLRAAVLRILAQPEHYEAAAEQGVQWVKENCAIENYAHRMAALTRAAVRDGAAG